MLGDRFVLTNASPNKTINSFSVVVLNTSFYRDIKMYALKIMISVATYTNPLQHILYCWKRIGIVAPDIFLSFDRGTHSYLRIRPCLITITNECHVNQERIRNYECVPGLKWQSIFSCVTSLSWQSGTDSLIRMCPLAKRY